MSKKINILNRDAELHNIKSISRMVSFLKRLLHSYVSIYKVFYDLHMELLEIENDTNFRKPDPQLLDMYNKSLIYMYNQIHEILNYKVITHGSIETFIINPVNLEKSYYDHKLEMTYFMKGLLCMVKHIGTTSNISIHKINDLIKIQRCKSEYSFVLLDVNTNITIEHFIEHIKNYEQHVKDLMRWLFNDIELIKIFFKTIIDILEDVAKMTNCSYFTKKWKKIFIKVKEVTKLINGCINELKK